VFEMIRRSLRDARQNPEWRYVIEGPNGAAGGHFAGDTPPDAPAPRTSQILLVVFSVLLTVSASPRRHHVSS
jgi:hypothetical protein